MPGAKPGQYRRSCGGYGQLLTLRMAAATLAPRTEDAVPPRYEESIDIAAPPERVWDVLRDVERWPEWTPSMKSAELLNGAMGPDGRARLNIAGAGGRPSDWTVTEWDEGRRFAWEAHIMPGFTSWADHRLEAKDGGTRVTLAVRMSGALAWPMWALFLGRVSRRNVGQEAAGLKRRSEEAVRSATTPS